MISLHRAAPYGPPKIALNMATDRLYMPALEMQPFGPVLAVYDGITDSITTIPLTRPQVHSIAVNPYTNRVYLTGQIASRGPSSLVIDGVTHAITEIPVDFQAGAGMAVNPQTNRIYMQGE